jgi:hypothetical protein
VQDHTTAEISWFALVGLTLSVKNEPAGTEWPTMAETDVALTLLQYDASFVRDEAWATAGTATRPNATTVARRRARHRKELYAGRLDNLERVLRIIGFPSDVALATRSSRHRAGAHFEAQ